MRKYFHCTEWLIPVWVRVTGSSLIQCEMTHASDQAAELKVDDPFILPDRFELLFSPIAQSWRECVIISRRYHARSVSIAFRGRHLGLHPVRQGGGIQEEPAGRLSLELDG